MGQARIWRSSPSTRASSWPKQPLVWVVGKSRTRRPSASGETQEFLLLYSTSVHFGEAPPGTTVTAAHHPTETAG